MNPSKILEEMTAWLAYELIERAPTYAGAAFLALFIGGCVQVARTLPDVPRHELTMEEIQDFYAAYP